MPETETLTREAAAARGNAVIRALPAEVIEQRRGTPIAVDVHSGDYEIDADDLKAVRAVRARRPAARIFLGRVGLAAFGRIGWFPTGEAR